MSDTDVPNAPAGEEDLLRLAVEMAPAGLLAVDAEGRMLLVNREVERLFGWTRAELLGQRVEMLIPAAYRAMHPGHRRGYFAHPSERRMGVGRDLHGVRKDGTEVPVEVGLNPVHSPDGLIVLASVVDISARKLAERELRESEDRLRQSQKLGAIGTLAGGIAHDFNNLLSAIVGYAELAQAAVSDRPEVQSDLGQVLNAAERGRQLVRRILTFSRAEEGHLEPIALGPAIAESLALLRATLPARITTREHLDPAAPRVRADSTQIQQVLMNLCTNAAGAIGERHGVMDVALGPYMVDADFARAHPELSPGLHARLTVSDTGCGMEPAVLERIFDPFFSTKPKGSGTGLGMSIVHGIVKAHRGLVTVRSTPGAGTTFDIYLPAETGVETTAAAAEPELPPARATLLYIEDEAALAQLARRQLESLGYRVVVCLSSVAALEEFKANPARFDGVITDNTMPYMTGLELAKEILALRPQTPIMLLSGLALTLNEAEVRAHGFKSMLAKPFRRDELVAAVEAMLAAAPRG